MARPNRNKLPEGAVKCPSCEEYNDRETLVWIKDFGWCCPIETCGYADPYWNQYNDWEGKYNG